MHKGEIGWRGRGNRGAHAIRGAVDPNAILNGPGTRTSCAANARTRLYASCVGVTHYPRQMRFGLASVP
eukprot:12888453-Prorocentrum_lima.AAC.1